MTTWVEVIDTAVKIGLGTVMGGVVTLAVTWATHRRDLTKEWWRRRLESLEHISDEFYAAHAEVMEKIAIAEYTRGKLIADGREDELPVSDPETLQGRAWFEKLLTTYRLEYSRLPLRRLHALEGRLHLLGLSKGANMLEFYQKMAASVEAELQERGRDQQLRDAWQLFERARSEFTQFLCSHYKP